jgi:hypothetical protein
MKKTKKESVTKKLASVFDAFKQIREEQDPRLFAAARKEIVKGFAALLPMIQDELSYIATAFHGQIKFLDKTVLHELVTKETKNSFANVSWALEFTTEAKPLVAMLVSGGHDKALLQIVSLVYLYENETAYQIVAREEYVGDVVGNARAQELRDEDDFVPTEFETENDTEVFHE